MKAVILAGGSGTRLWPLSRKEYPKQFLKINGSLSLLQQTVTRLVPLVSRDDLVVVTNEKHRFHVLSDLNEVDGGPVDNLILEPVGRNTAPAIGLSALYCLERLGCGMDEVMVVLPSDHIIRPDDEFRECLGRAAGIAREGFLVTLGIKPTRPETGYGYIRAGKPVNQQADCFSVEEFTEKPDAETAARYFSEGRHFWNAGIFVFTIDTILDELRQWSPEIHQRLSEGFDEALSSFAEMPDISIDYAVLEKSGRVAVMPVDLYWNDVGCFESMYEAFERDGDGNIKIGDVFSMDTRDSFVIGSKRLIATIGLQGIVVIETDDAVLITTKDRTQKVKDVVEALRARGRREVIEHTVVYRPWGSYTVLEEGPRYKIKRIEVNPGARLSLQMHFHRSEHWVVVKGTAMVTIGDVKRYIHENESAYVPKSTLHRLENPGKVPVEIIEVQNGEYVEEDDIERFDDVYGRERRSRDGG
ncbi:MAG: mannose-1-phosphate guanylyltransferase/mannose-6-phosphate isomerase [Nitrospirae bacterium]|nr:mannose-1-phosphate guanylyltransferase/mannose-6-phosphate isomerase [Nitrospirota bacterium]